MTTSINKFSFDPKTGWLVAEASDFTGSELFHQIYQDACDIGMAIVGRNGKTVRYYLAEEKRDDEGDLQVQILLPCPEDVRKVSSAAGTQIHILND